jgi:hypothetical protein
MNEWREKAIDISNAFGFSIKRSMKVEFGALGA